MEGQMFCDKCEAAFESRHASKETPYLYDLAGGWHLSGITVYRCPKCGTESPLIPKIEKLHALMADRIAAKPSELDGQEIRFLRKHAGCSAKRFANLMGVTPEYLSRVENGKPKHKKFGKAADRLARLLVSETEPARQALMRIADQIGARKPTAPVAKRAFRLVGGTTWKPAA
jgi:DNA-binding transcriptional regulator YiaG